MVSTRSLFVVLACACLARCARAAIVWTGDVYPPNPTTWTSTTDSTIGSFSAGTLTVEGGSTLISDRCDIAGTVGGVTVRGAGSTWNTSRLIVGSSGKNTLTIL